MAQQEMNTVLIADLGNVHTRLVLLDLVEGQYRLVASARSRSTGEPPLSRVVLGLERATQDMEKLTGRTLLNPGSPAIFAVSTPQSDGIDAFLATSSAGQPMRVLLIGLTEAFSISSARRALGGTYVQIVDTLTPYDTRSREEQLNALLTNDIDLIMIVGGTDHGGTELVRELVAHVALALALATEDQRPSVLYAGNRELRETVRAQLEPYTTVFMTQNVHPTTGEEQIFPVQIELAFVYDEHRSRSPGKFNEVGRVSAVGVVPTSQGYISAVRYMAGMPGGMDDKRSIGPLCLDVGSATSVIAAGVHGQTHYTIRTDLGIGHQIAGTLETITPQVVQRWLPFEIETDALWDYVYNKQLRPSTIPATLEELQIEQAIAREILRALVSEARPAWGQGESNLLPAFNPIFVSGAVLTEAQHPGISALMLLDALQPTGLVDMRLDPNNLVSSLGVAAYLKPLMTVQALESGGMVSLGTAFCPLGRVRTGRKAMTVRITTPDKRQIERVVRGGEIWIAPLLPGEAVTVQARLHGGLSINGKRRVKGTFTTGAAGLIFDARGRPLALPRERDRIARYTEWQMAMRGRERRPSAAPEAAPESTAHPEEQRDAVPS